MILYYVGSLCSPRAGSTTRMTTPPPWELLARPLGERIYMYVCMYVYIYIYIYIYV